MRLLFFNDKFCILKVLERYLNNDGNVSSSLYKSAYSKDQSSLLLRKSILGVKMADSGCVL